MQSVSSRVVGSRGADCPAPVGLGHVVFVEGAEVGYADVEELADFEAAFVVGEHGGIELGGGARRSGA